MTRVPDHPTAALLPHLLIATIVPSLAFTGCMDAPRFTVFIQNLTDERVVAHLSMMHTDDRTEFFNATYALSPHERVVMRDHPSIEGNLTVRVWTDGGLHRTDDRTGGCGVCGIYFYIEEDRIRWGNSIA